MAGREASRGQGGAIVARNGDRMKKHVGYALALALATLAPAALAAEGLQPRLGLWETTTRMDGGKPDVDKTCLTKAGLAEFVAGDAKDDDADCKYTKGPQVSGNTWSAERACAGVRSRAEVVMDSPEQVHAKLVMLSDRGPGSTIQIAARWVAPDCGKVR